MGMTFHVLQTEICSCSLCKNIQGHFVICLKIWDQDECILQFEILELLMFTVLKCRRTFQHCLADLGLMYYNEA